MFQLSSRFISFLIKVISTCLFDDQLQFVAASMHWKWSPRWEVLDLNFIQCILTWMMSLIPEFTLTILQIDATAIVLTINSTDYYQLLFSLSISQWNHHQSGFSFVVISIFILEDLSADHFYFSTSTCKLHLGLSTYQPHHSACFSLWIITNNPISKFPAFSAIATSNAIIDYWQ